MSLPLPLSYRPMEAELVQRIPRGHWQYEPKWDGFRVLVFRDGDEVFLQSKSGQQLARYFPEVVEAVRALPPRQFVLDGELVIPVDEHLSFDDLLQRIHPAASRIARLAVERPALLILFDILVDARGRSLVDLPLHERRAALEEFVRGYVVENATVRLSPVTTELTQATQWLEGAGDATDGIVAKQQDQSYQSGNRAMQKIKVARTADCVVGGFRYASDARVVGSLLLGLYDDAGLLHHVGFCSGLSDADRVELLKRLKPLIRPPGFTGRAPGGPSRWSTKRSTEWEPLEPRLVVEVRYDHFTAQRFRHGTRLLRWRPDKAPRQCTMAQVIRESQIGPVQLLPENSKLVQHKLSLAKPRGAKPPRAMAQRKMARKATTAPQRRV